MAAKLSPRLQALLQAIPPGFACLWDLCCDHGQLGSAVLSQKLCRQVIFVDQLPGAMQQLALELAAQFNPDQYQVICQDACQLTQTSTEPELMVLAGVGDITSLAILDALKAPNRHWLISPANNHFALRAELQQRALALVNEGLVFDRGYAYEWLLLQPSANSKIPLMSPHWQPQQPEHQQELQKRLARAQKQCRHHHKIHAAAEVQALEALLAG